MKHRFNITLTADEYESLKGYSEFVGKPPATVAADLLREMMPTMKEVAAALNSAKKKHTKGIEELRTLAFQEISSFSALASSLQGVADEAQAPITTTKEQEG